MASIVSNQAPGVTSLQRDLEITYRSAKSLSDKLGVIADQFPRRGRRPTHDDVIEKMLRGGVLDTRTSKRAKRNDVVEYDQMVCDEEFVSAENEEVLAAPINAHRERAIGRGIRSTSSVEGRFGGGEILLGYDDAAEVLRITRGQLEGLISRGDLDAVLSEGRSGIRRTVLEDFAKKHGLHISLPPFNRDLE